MTTPRLDLTEQLHGVPVPDPYRWLEDATDARTVAWEASQAARFARERDGWKQLDAWRDALTAAFHVDLVSAPRPRGERMFLARLRAGEEHPVLMVSEDGVERPLVDPLALDPGGNVVLEAWEPSVDGGLLAYQLSSGGSEDCLLRVLEVATGEQRDGPIDRVRRSSIAWLPDDSGFYYVRRLPADHDGGGGAYRRRVYLHRLGTVPDEDVLIFGDGRDDTEFYTVRLTADGRWLVITATLGAARSNRIWLADLRSAPAERPQLRPLVTDRPGWSSTRVVPGTGPRDPIWLRTDLDAPRGRVVVTAVSDLASARWRTLIPERPDAVLEDFVPLVDEALPRPVALVAWSRHAVSELTVHDLTSGRELSRIALPGIGRVAALTAAPDYQHQAWFVYTDHDHPPQVLHYDARTGQVRPWVARSGSPPGRPPRARLVSFRSRDGTTVRMFIVGDDVADEGPRPTILTGYGGFGQSMALTYQPQVSAWVRAGGVFATACLRGGAEEGRQWHRAGTTIHKQRTIDDLHAAADHLIHEGWTTPDQLGLFGGSNGGLVVSAAVTQRPEQYAAVACLAPLTDMVRYERSGMGPSWRAEYGSVQDPAEFRALLAYSPYHQLTPGISYPAFLLGAFDADSRVDPAHARKFAAALQHASGSRPVVYRQERDSGHGARAASRTIGLLADVLAFLGHHLDLAPPEQLR